MGKVNEYASGRSDGLQMALRLVEENGIDALREEIKFRGITGINTVLCKKEVEKASQKMKEMTCDTIMCLAVLTLHDEFGYSKKRCERFMQRFNLKADCLVDDMCSWQDIIDTVKEELGIEMTIRRND